MLRRIPVLAIPLTFLALIAGFAYGCGPRPPVAYQQLQIQDTEESRGYDVYLYISVNRALPASDVTALLEWFRDVRYADQNKIAIYVWDNPQAALVGAMGDMVASLEVDRKAGIDNLKVNVPTR